MLLTLNFHTMQNMSLIIRPGWCKLLCEKFGMYGTFFDVCGTDMGEAVVFQEAYLEFNMVREVIDNTQE